MFHRIMAVRHRLDSLVTTLTRRRRVFIATWMEGKNFGDDYLSSSLTDYMASICPGVKIVRANLHLDDFHLTPEDVLLIGGGGLWGPNGSGRLEERLYRAWMRAPGPLIVANIGIESFDSSSASQLTELSDKASLFSVRDETSWRIAADVLGEGKVLWGADNTYLHPIRVQREPVAGRLGVNLCGPEMENYRRRYPIQTIIESIRRLSACGYTVQATVFTYAGPLSDHKHCLQVDPDCPPCSSIAPYRHCELFIGMHFHSVVLALQNDVPVIAISYSDKVQRIMQEYDLGAYCLQPEDPDLFPRMFSLIRTMDKAEVIQRIRQGNERARRRLIPFARQLRMALGSTEQAIPPATARGPTGGIPCSNLAGPP
jgi:hypothetical protein